MKILTQHNNADKRLRDKVNRNRINDEDVMNSFSLRVLCMKEVIKGKPRTGADLNKQ